MNKTARRLRSRGGWTIIEFLITIAIMGILFSIVGASYETLKAKIRFSQIRADMDAIAKASYTAYSIGDPPVWPEMTVAGMPPALAAGLYLNKWPTPPCPQWFYSWEDWTAFGIDDVSVTLRKPGMVIIYKYCVSVSPGTDCYSLDPFSGAAPQDIVTTDVKRIYCGE